MKLLRSNAAIYLCQRVDSKWSLHAYQLGVNVLMRQLILEDCRKRRCTRGGIKGTEFADMATRMVSLSLGIGKIIVQFVGCEISFYILY